MVQVCCHSSVVRGMVKRTACSMPILGALAAYFCVVGACTSLGAGEPGTPLKLEWDREYLTISGPFPSGSLTVMYLEAFCRPGGHKRPWNETVIKHTTELVERNAEGTRLRLRSRLADGVVVDHVITSTEDEVDFRLVASNPGERASEVQWAQPCIRVGTFTGKGQDDYISQCFVFISGELVRLPTKPWATEALYTPGQVYRAPGVKAEDVNPRPLSPLIPSNGLCGCFSADGQWIMATAWEPYHELFQGVITCIHADFAINGLAPGERKEIRGKIYIVGADVSALVARYERDFPEHVAGQKASQPRQ